MTTKKNLQQTLISSNKSASYNGTAVGNTSVTFTSKTYRDLVVNDKPICVDNVTFSTKSVPIEDLSKKIKKKNYMMEFIFSADDIPDVQ